MSESEGFSFDTDPDQSVSVLVLHEIAKYTNRDTNELDSLLYDYIDTDALDDLFAHSNGETVHVEFQYETLRIIVRSEDEIDVLEADLE